MRAIRPCLLILLGGLVACGDDHDHGDGHDDLAQLACDHVSVSGASHDAAADPDTVEAERPLVTPGDDPIAVTLPSEATGYVWIETTVQHVDLALFTDRPGLFVELVNPNGDAVAIEDQGAPPACDQAIAADWRAHVHEPGHYRLALDGSAGDDAWIMVLDEASSHGEGSHTHP